MIQIEMSLTIPDMSEFTFTDSFQQISKYLELSIKKNFQDGGRPTKWQAKKNGQPSHLFIAGTLFNTIGSDSGEDFAEAGAMTLLPYSMIHQYRFNGVRKDGRRMVMPIREYVMFQEEDIDYCIRIMGDELLDFWNTKGEPIT